jgi:putative hydrolase of the HAD superfamily
MTCYRYLIWDFDGTLAHRPGGWSAALAAVAGPGISAEQVRPFLQSGFPWHAHECAHLGLSPDEWWEELIPLFTRALRGAGLPAEEARSLACNVRSEYLRPGAWQRFEDAVPALDQLSARGWQHLLLTNHVPELPSLLGLLGLSGRFEAIFNSAETGDEKPNPHAFRNVLNWILRGRRTGSLAEISPILQIWVIGDRLSSDVIGAQEAGLRAILVRQREPGFTCCESLAELADVLD